MKGTRLPKSRIAASFSRAATQYDASAHVQRLVADQLLELASAYIPANGWVIPANGLVADLGVGTGYLAEGLRARLPRAQLIGLDLSWSMLKQTEKHPDWLGRVQADVEALPFAQNTLSLLVSSLAFQWCSDLPRLLAESHRALQPGGRLVFSTLLPGSLAELGAAWAALGLPSSLHAFASHADWQHAFETSGFVCHSALQQPQVMTFADLNSLLRSLRGVGANMSAAEPRPFSRRLLSQLAQAYPVQAGIYPLTYEVFYVALQKTV